MAVFYHNGCPTEETAWEGMKPEYENVHMFIVDVLNAADIRDKYADGNQNPYWKFYSNGGMVEEVKYKKPWSDQEPILRSVMAKHNGSVCEYASSGEVVEL